MVLHDRCSTINSIIKLRMMAVISALTNWCLDATEVDIKSNSPKCIIDAKEHMWLGYGVYGTSPPLQKSRSGGIDGSLEGVQERIVLPEAYPSSLKCLHHIQDICHKYL